MFIDHMPLTESRAMTFLDRFYLLLCWGLSVLFIYAGMVKLLSPETFAVLIEAYGILPEQLVLPVAVILPAFEVLAGIGLLLNIRGSLSAIALLMILFVAILTYGIWMGLDVDCGCFGDNDPEADAFHGLWTSLYRDLAMLAGITLLFGWRRYRAIQSVPARQFIKNHLNRRSA